jgi:hydroxyethylthiazole kinase-like uncharacterized protein yjeF
MLKLTFLKFTQKRRDMKVLNREQIREADAYTIENEPIKSIDLMERASERFTKMFRSLFKNNKAVYVFCGVGNNGGDGLVVSRLLAQKKYLVTTVVVHYSEKQSKDFTLNYDRLKSVENIEILNISSEKDFPEIKENAVVIDALWGTGLTRPIGGFAREIIMKINKANAARVALDIPSGMFCDEKNEDDAIVKADYTFSFQCPKYSFFMPENYQYVGEWKVIDIGLDQSFIESLNVKENYFRIPEAKNIKKVRSKFDHKGNFGHALIIAGSKGKIGAAVLGAKACLKTGAGLVSAYVPECGYSIMQSSIPEVMVLTDVNQEIISNSPELNAYNTIGIGPGLGMHPKTQKAFEEIITGFKFPVVVDADGINIISQNKELLEKLPEESILTPHIGEFDRLVGKSSDHYHRLSKARKLAKEFRINIVLKGAFTAVCLSDGNLFFNSTGNPGMATAGSGDVLTGVITSLLAQGYQPMKAALLGVFIHGMAGDKALKDNTYETLIASDIISCLNQVFKKL